MADEIKKGKEEQQPALEHFALRFDFAQQQTSQEKEYNIEQMLGKSGEASGENKGGTK